MVLVVLVGWCYIHVSISSTPTPTCYSTWKQLTLIRVLRCLLCLAYLVASDQQFAVSEKKRENVRMIDQMTWAQRTLFRIASARSRNARSMLMFALALVSRNRIPCSRAMVSPRSLLTTRLSCISHLLPRIIFSTSSLAC